MEPLKTDEPIKPGAYPRPKDMDSVMLGGCTAFVITSVASYGLTLWPHLVFPESYHLRTLVLCCALGMIPAMILGAISIRTAGLPGACGFVAGAMTTAVFIFLRLQQLFLGSAANQSPTPNYPESFRTLLPLAWVGICLAMAIVLIPKKEFQSENDADST